MFDCEKRLKVCFCIDLHATYVLAFHCNIAVCFYNRCVQVRENERINRRKKNRIYIWTQQLCQWLTQVNHANMFDLLFFCCSLTKKNAHKKLFCNLISLNMEECENHVFWLEPLLILPFGFICNVFKMIHVDRSVPVVVKLYTFLDKV